MYKYTTSADLALSCILLKDMLLLIHDYAQAHGTCEALFSKVTFSCSDYVD